MPRTLVRHRTARAGAAEGWSITDDDGRLRLPGTREAILLRPLAHTSVARMSTRTRTTAPILTRDGDEREVPPSPELALMAALVAAYDRGLRGFTPFRDLVEPAWPLGVAGAEPSLRTPVVAVVYPDRTPARLPYVEPSAPGSGLPRIRLQRGNLDATGRPLDPAVLAHELAHALHFSLLSARIRMGLQARYAAWLTARVATGRDPTHAAERRTSPFVAWLEAFGLFAERYDRFVTSPAAASPDPSNRHAAFVTAEVLRWHHLLADPDPAVEGSVYATAILRPAQETSLGAAVAAYLDSARRGVLDQHTFEANRGLRH